MAEEIIEPISHLEKVIAQYLGGGASSEALEELDNKIEALKSTQSLEYEGENVTCENTLASRTSDMLIKGKTYKNPDTSGIESAGEKENKINILSNNNKLVNDVNYKQDKKEILLPVEGGLKSLSNGVADTIEQRNDGVYLVQRVKKETYVNGDENNNNYLTDNVNTYKPLQTPVETKLDIQNIDLEVYEDTTYITTENAIQPTLNFKVPSNLGGMVQANSQNINKLYKLIDEVIIPQLINNSADIEILKLK